MKRKFADERRGAVLPLFAVLLPVLLILCAFAINIAYMQLTRTELKIASDAAARAGGRAWSHHQSVSQAQLFARQAAVRNMVSGKQLRLQNSEIEFGSSVRTNSGSGRYSFVTKDTAAVAAGTEEANSVRVLARFSSASRNGPVNLLMGGVGGRKTFSPEQTSVCTQLDRDVALVIDRSGSMAYGVHDIEMFQITEQLYLDGKIDWRELYRANYGTEASITGRYPAISQTNLYNRSYSQNVLNQLQVEAVNNPTAQKVLDYAVGMNAYNSPSAGSSTSPAPPFSRWDLALEAVAAFNEVLVGTDQEELISLGTFNTNGSLDLSLTDDSLDYREVTDAVTEIRPFGGTGIGRGLMETIPSLVAAGSGARPFAKKTIVILTDGRETRGVTPTADDAARSIVGADDVQIHTVTFTDGADKSAMEGVAAIGNGKHYHANDGGELIEIFREIANNLPTLITE